MAHSFGVLRHLQFSRGGTRVHGGVVIRLANAIWLMPFLVWNLASDPGIIPANRLDKFATGGSRTAAAGDRLQVQAQNAG